MTWTLEAPDFLWQAVRDDLLSTPSLERAGIGFAGISRQRRGRRLLLRDWIPVPAGEYLAQHASRVEVSPAFWARHAKRAQATGEALIILHSHPRCAGAPEFSPSDNRGEAQLIPKIQGRAPVPVAAVVLSPGGGKGRITGISGDTEQMAIRHTGRLQHGEQEHLQSERFDRQALALGQEGQATLRMLAVGVAGAGGLGSHVIQQLIHLGIGHVIVADHDRVTTSNLSRLVGASRTDATFRRAKISVARRHARRVGGPSRITSLRSSVTDQATARRLLECDLVIGCTDNQWSRAVLNEIAYQYYVPVLDLGTELQASGAMGGRVTWLAPGSPCLWCLAILDPQRVRSEQLPPQIAEQEITRGYIQGLNAPTPAVISINGAIASLAVTELLARATGFAGREPRASQLMYRLSDGTVRRTSLRSRDACPTCSAGQLGLADLGSAPWRPPPAARQRWHGRG